MANFFASSPLLLLFVVAAVGFIIGRIEIFSTKLGIAAVLFVGLAFGAWDPRLQLPELIQSFGLVLFVYTIGLSCGPGFIGMMRGKGWRQSALVVMMIVFASGLSLLFHHWWSLDAASSAGLFAGALTNTPALAAVTELAKNNAPSGSVDQSSAAVVAYSIAYPFGVLGVIAVISFFKKIWSEKERSLQPEQGHEDNQKLMVKTLHVKHPAITGRPLRSILEEAKLEIVAGRRLSKGELSAFNEDDSLELDDLFTVVGCEDEIRRAEQLFGPQSLVRLEEDRSRLDFRRILVSNPKLAGRTLADLKLLHKYGAVVTRLRRGDVEMLPNGKIILELGDRLRIVAPHKDIDAISRYLGDSERNISEVDVISLGLGIAVGLGLGLIPIPIPGGLSLRLGVAGGPMVVALILGAMSRTGPILWSLPHGANLTLRQLGLVMFLACVGTRAGRPFIDTLSHGAFGWQIFFAGAVITMMTSALTLWIGHRLLKLPLNLMFGIVGGMQTQPALLAYAQEQTSGEEAGLGYASVFPLAFISKVVIAQIIFIWLSSRG